MGWVLRTAVMEDNQIAFRKTDHLSGRSNVDKKKQNSLSNNIHKSANTQNREGASEYYPVKVDLTPVTSFAGCQSS